MNAGQQIRPPLDDIRVFMPGVDESEYRQRARIRSARNVAVKALLDAPAGTSRTLFILLRDHCDDWIYRPGLSDHLDLAVEQCLRLFKAAQVAEDLERAS